MTPAPSAGGEKSKRKRRRSRSHNRPHSQQQRSRNKEKKPYARRVDEISAGGLVIDSSGSKGLLIGRLDAKDQSRERLLWSLPKGHIEEGESPEEGTIRELKEEISLDIKIIEKLGENEYVAHHPERGPVKKHVYYFLAQADYVPLVLESTSGGLKDAKWFGLPKIPQQ